MGCRQSLQAVFPPRDGIAIRKPIGSEEIPNQVRSIPFSPGRTSRGTPARWDVIHSDQGIGGGFKGSAFTRRAIDSGLLPSMGAVGSGFDNALIESFWSRMRVELLGRQTWRTRVELANAIFEYLEIFRNRQRRHSALGMLTPVEFETRHQAETVA